MSEFLKKIVGHAEVKRGFSHLLVGVAIGLVATMLEARKSAE